MLNIFCLELPVSVALIEFAIRSVLMLQRQILEGIITDSTALGNEENHYPEK